LIYKPHENHTFRISGSVAYRPPSILETHNDVRNVVIPFNFSASSVGSQNLEPEKIVSYEAGYQGWYLKHRLRVRGDVFFNHISNFIGGAATLDPLVFTFGNLGQADLYGAEVGLEFLATTWLTGFINYSTVQVHQTSDLVAQQGLITRGAPPYKVNAGLRGEWENGFSAEALLHYVAAASYPISTGYPFFSSTFGGFDQPVNSVPNYTLLNVRGAYRFWKDKAEVAVSAFNALNDRHRENPVGEVIGSRVMGWLTIRY
jgi:iron complex outermembrane receptor protein